ncbi:MAG: hypothetical protein QOF17_1006 [Solirubrobacteraceae bacterium]|nr:hypothetical protein [Solirubrobacteraceae bacterium]
MRRSPVVVLAVVALAVLAGAVAGRPLARSAAGGGHRLAFNADETVRVTAVLRRGGPSFSPEVAPADRAWILAALAAARPEARRLIGEVDGAVTFRTGGTQPAQAGGETIGLAESSADGFEIWLNVARLDHDRAVDRPTAVLHELGHVVDYALVGPELGGRLDAAIAPDPNVAEERFADTFAKWALRGEVSLAGAGYQIPTPVSLEDWGAPLGALAAGLPPG